MNLLIVDDEIYVVRALQKNIDWRAAGIDQVFVAFHAAKAREIIKNNNIDIIVTDIEMPGESGLSLLRWVKEEGLDMIGICLTSHAEFAYAQEALRYRVMEYVVKPLNFKAFAELISRAAKKRRSELTVREQQEKGRLWEYHVKKVRSQFWEALVKGMQENSQDSLIDQAQRMTADYDFSMEYLLILFCVRRIYEHRSEWEDSRDLMEYVTVNIAQEVLLREEDSCRIGWLDGRLWVILPEDHTDGLTENLENFLDVIRKITGAGLAAYLDAPCFGEQIHQIYRKLKDFDRKNVTIDQGILSLRDCETTEDGVQILSAVETLVKEREFERISQVLMQGCTGKEHIRFQSLLILIEAVKYGLFSHMEKNHLDLREFWTEELAEEHRGIYDSVENFAEWLEAAVKRVKEMQESQSGDADVIAEIKRFVKSNIENRITREMIAEHINFSPDYLGRIFKRETGLSLSEYIMEQKVERARELLDEDVDTIGNIAVRLGYSSFSYFSEVFRRLTGIAPSDYKRKKD